jgi:hypothetical protein
LPATVALQDTVAAPDPATLAGLNAPQVRPLGGVSLKVTVALKWFNRVTVTDDVADWVTSTAAGEVALIVKSWNMKVAVAE